MSYFKYLKKYWKLIVMNSVVHIYQRFYSIPLWCSWKVVQNLPGRFCDKRSVWQCHMIAWWTEKNLKSFFTTLYMGFSFYGLYCRDTDLSQVQMIICNCKILRWNWHFCRLLVFLENYFRFLIVIKKSINQKSYISSCRV